MKDQKKGKSFWKKLGLVAGILGIAYAGALAEKKFGVVNKTVDLTVKSYGTVKTGVQKLLTKQPQVSSVNVDTTPARNNYQGTNYSRKYNN